MKKYVLIILLLFTTFSFSQMCGSDMMLNYQMGQDPKFKSNIIALSELIKRDQNGKLMTDEIITVPVVYHLVYPSHYSFGEGANVHASLLQRQINRLNTSFSGGFGGVDTKIQFCIAQKDISGIDNYGIKRYPVGEESYEPFSNNENTVEIFRQVDADIKSHYDLAFPNTAFLNIWIVDLKFNSGDDLYGYSSFPYGGEFDKLETIDGVVIDYKMIDTVIATHEVGHWAGLFHVFANFEIPNAPDYNNCAEFDCNNQGDFVCDTDTVNKTGNTNIASGYCKGYNCFGETTDVVQNYMDYQNADRRYCMTKFTKGQKDRMRRAFELYRNTIYNNSVFGHNDYCIPSATEGGYPTGGGIYSYENCQKCYQPSINLSVNYNLNVRRQRQYVGSTFIEIQESTPFTSNYTGELTVYQKECETLENVFSYNFNLTGGASSSIHIVNDSFFIIQSTKFYGRNKFNKLSLFKKKNNHWTFDREINLTTDFGYLRITDYGCMIHKSSASSYYRYDTNRNVFTFAYSTNTPNKDEYFKLSNKGYYHFKKSGSIMESWVFNESKYYLESTTRIPIPHEYIGPDKLVGYDIGTNYMIIKNKVNGNTLSNDVRRILYKKSGSVWKEIQEFEDDWNGSKRHTILNDSMIMVEYYSSGSDLNCDAYRFYRKNSTGIFQPISLLHLNPNAISSFDYLTSNSVHYNSESNEILLDDQILKLRDIYQVNENEIPGETVMICNPPNEETIQGSSIILGENCEFELPDRIHNFKARNEIIIKSGVKISSGNILFSIDDDSNCDFPETCPPGTSGKSELMSIISSEKLNLTSKNLNNKEPVKVYPNPTRNILYIEALIGSANWELTNSYGRLVFKNTISINDSSITEIDLSSLPLGIYTLKIYSNNNELFIKKIIKN